MATYNLIKRDINNCMIFIDLGLPTGGGGRIVDTVCVFYVIYSLIREVDTRRSRPELLVWLLGRLYFVPLCPILSLLHLPFPQLSNVIPTGPMRNCWVT